MCRLRAVANRRTGNDYVSALSIAGFGTMIDDQDLGFFANMLGIFLFVLVIAYHYVVADAKYEGN
ncbi:hypothetical protein WN943_018380 [Citrus x changshan-huyou]